MPPLKTVNIAHANKKDSQILIPSTETILFFDMFQVSQKVLDKVNCKHKNRKYSNEKAAQEIYGTPFKGNLTLSPFICELEHGKNSDGYWT